MVAVSAEPSHLALGSQTVQSMRRNLKNVFELESEDQEKYVMPVFCL